MKKALLLVACLVVITGLICGSAKWFRVHTKVASDAVASAQAPHPNAPANNHPAPLMATDEWQKFRDARQAAQQANPSFQNEYKQILNEMDAQQTRLDAAMIKADPKAAPVVAKLVALRAENGGSLSTAHSPTTGQAGNSTAVKLTPEEWQIMRSARSKAMQTDTGFTSGAMKLAEKMRAYEDHLDAAMIKADPDVAPLIAKFEAGRHSQTAQMTSPSPK